MNELELARLLPVAPRPETDERLSSWLARIAVIYRLPVGALLAHCGLVGADPFALEKASGQGRGPCWPSARASVPKRSRR